MPPQSGLVQDTLDRTQVDREVRVQVNTETKPRFELSVPKVIAAALAAASAAVAASWLGVAGTVIGAVVASLVASVTTALYSHPLEKSSQVIRETLPTFPAQRVYGSPDLPAQFGPDGTQVLPADPALPAHETVAVTATRARLQWGPILVSALLALVIGVGILTGAEYLLGRPVSAVLTGNDGGGTTIGRLVHHSGGSGSTGSSSKNGNGTKPEPTVPTSTQPTQPTPTQPTPTEPTPTEPTPTEPTPTDPTPTSGSSTDGTSPTGAASTAGASVS